MTQKSSSDPPRKVVLGPESLTLKFILLSRLPFDRRAGRKHYLVYGFLLDYFHSGYGDALASVRHIVACLKERDPFGKGLYIGDVHSALADLVEWGYLTQQKGSGRAASRYVPVWGDVPSVRGDQNTTGGEICVRGYPNTTVRAGPNATGDSVRKITNEDPLTVTRSLDPGTQEGGPDPAGASPHHQPGALAAPAGGEAAVEGFEELYVAYGLRRGKGAARAAYENLNPSLELHCKMVAAAKAWRAAWEAQGKPEAPRKHLATWIREECFDCDPPTGYRKKAKAGKPAPAPANDNPAPARLSPGRHIVTIVDSDVPPDRDGTKTVEVVLEIDGTERRQEFITKSDDHGAERDGQRRFAALCRAAGLESVDDTVVLHGRAIVAVVAPNGRWDFDAISDEDEAAA